MTNVMLQDPFKVQDRPVDFTRTDDEKFFDMVSNSPLQLIFKKSRLLSFSVTSKKNIQFSEKAAYTSTRLTYCNSWNGEADLLLRPDIKDICKNVKQCHSPHLISFVLEKNVIFY